MGFLPEGKTLSDLLPRNLRNLESFEGFNIILDYAILPFIKDVIEKGLINLRESQDIDRTNFPLQLSSIFGIPLVIAKDSEQILLRLRAQAKVLPFCFLNKGLAKSILLYLQSLGLSAEIEELFGQNAIILNLFERYILDSFDTEYRPGFVFRNAFDGIDPIVANVKKLLPMWVKLQEVKVKGVEFIQRLDIGDELLVPDIEFLESLVWVSYRIEDRGIPMQEQNGFDLPNNIWDPPPGQGLIFDGSLIVYLNLPPTDFLSEIDENAGLAGNTTASWDLDYPKIVENSFTFEINDGIITYKGKDDGNGNIVDNGSTGGGSVVSGTVNYLTGAVSIIVSNAFSTDVDAESQYRLESDYLSVV